MGCVEAEIGSAAWAIGQTMATMDYALIFIEMSSRIKQILDWASKKSRDKPSNLTIGECRDFKNFLATVVGRRNGAVSIKRAKVAINEETKDIKRSILAEFSLSGPEIDTAERTLEDEIVTLS